jgi:hypothetical protein
MNLILLAFSFVCAVIACFQIGDPIWRKLIAAAIAFFVAAQIFGGLASAHILH